MTRPLVGGATFSVLSTQIEKLKALKGRKYEEAKADEREWYQLTERLIARSFGIKHPNLSNFQYGWYAVQKVPLILRSGFSTVSYTEQSNFEARLQAFEGVLKNCLEELHLDLPDNAIKGVYEPGEEYEFYRDVASCLKLAQREIFVIDPYLSTEIFDVYAGAIPRTIMFKLLSASIPVDVQNLGTKYAAGGNFAFRSTNSVHDRVLFADDRVWVTGQSLKDAARKKPTYIVEHDEPLMRQIYENIWNAATTIL